MGYFDENEEKEKDGISALAEGLSSKEEKALEKERRKEEKRLEKERRKKEKEALKKGETVSELESTVRITPERDGGDPVVPAGAAAAEAAKQAGDAAEGAAKEAAGEAKDVKEGVEAVLEAEEEAEGKKKRKKKKKKRDEKPEDVNIVKDLLSLIIYIGIVVLLCFLIVTFVGRRTTVHGDSMEPTLQSGDSLWINMLAYKFGDPKRFDIIVFPYEDDVHYIKRIIGLPGETVQILDNGDILINGEVLKEPKTFDRILNPNLASSPITLGADEYFVLGDNRNNSRDSRYADVGNIKRDKIVGKAVFRLTPLKKFGSIE